ncbi:MAG: 4Fe-4S dicluster domain-containing protein [Clostridia bacterium]|nr:4Fe-4S dicluster domain-containing protein [Clostridia bacterium]
MKKKMTYTFSGGKRFPFLTPLKDRFIRLKPAEVRIPLEEKGQILVREGDSVSVGTCIQRAFGENESPVYSSVSGKVLSVATCFLPDGRETGCVVLESDLEDRPEESLTPWPKHLSHSTREELALLARIGAIYDPLTARPLFARLKEAGETDYLIVSLVSADPAFQSSHALTEDYAEKVVDGAKILAQALNCVTVCLACPCDDYYMLKKYRDLSSDAPYIKVCAMKMKFPQGAPALLSRQIAKDSSSFPVDGEACVRLAEMFLSGQPETSVFLSVEKDPGFFVRVEAPIGTSCLDVFSLLGKTLKKNLWSGGVVGRMIDPPSAVIVRGIRALSPVSDRKGKKEPEENVCCISCGRCQSVCPAGLSPVMILREKSREDGGSGVDYRASDCLSCGLCSYVCPVGLDVFRVVKETAEKEQETGETGREGGVSDGSVDA